MCQQRQYNYPLGRLTILLYSLIPAPYCEYNILYLHAPMDANNLNQRLISQSRSTGMDGLL